MQANWRSYFWPALLAVGALSGGACSLVDPANGDLDSQQAYAFPGCDDANDRDCPNSGTFACAVETIAERHRECAQDSDCRLVRIDDCIGLTACQGLAIATAEGFDFGTEVSAEVSRYCADARCRSSPSCVPLTERAACESGRCVNRISLDAGHDSQAGYSYPGCEDAGTYGCPNDLVLGCALETIISKHNACQQPTDCVAAPAPNCIGIYSTCPPAAVNDAGRAAFDTEAALEINRYCDGALCRSSGSCAFSYQQGRVDCVNGRCIALPDLDGGS